VRNRRQREKLLAKLGAAAKAIHDTKRLGFFLNLALAISEIVEFEPRTQTTKLSLISTIFTLLCSTGLDAAETSLRADVDAAQSPNKPRPPMKDVISRLKRPRLWTHLPTKFRTGKATRRINAVSIIRTTTADRGLVTSAATMTTTTVVKSTALEY
jgi:hypothetical protein